MYERGVLPAVSLETYLTGNTDDQSLGSGMRADFDLPRYACALRSLAKQKDVSHVFVEVRELPDLGEPEDQGMWAQALIVHVVTTLSTQDVRAQLAQLEPRSVDEGWCAAPGVEPPLAEIPASFRVVRVDLS